MASDKDLQAAYQAALEDAKSMLRYRFDVEKIFFDIPPWDPSATYSTDDPVSLEADYWQSSTEYQSGDLVQFEDHVYEAQATLSGVAPDDSADWVQVGEADTIYVSKSDTNTSKPNNTTDWEQKDPRHQNIRLYLVDMVIYHLYSLTQPRQVPEMRKNRKDDAKAFFEKVRKGEVDMELPPVYAGQDDRDDTVRVGGPRRMSY